jgi:hypothetical protein
MRRLPPDRIALVALVAGGAAAEILRPDLSPGERRLAAVYAVKLVADAEPERERGAFIRDAPICCCASRRGWNANAKGSPHEQRPDRRQRKQGRQMD